MKAFAISFTMQLCQSLYALMAALCPAAPLKSLFQACKPLLRNRSINGEPATLTLVIFTIPTVDTMVKVITAVPKGTAVMLAAGLV